MSVIRVELGTVAVLSLQTYDGDVAVFPQARVYDKNFSEVSGSPFALTHVAGGLYKNTSFTPTTQGIYHATYKVYSDSGFTAQLKRHAIVMDEFDVNNLFNDIDSNEGRAI